MNHRFILMPPTWSGVSEHVVRPLNHDRKGEVPWIALARAEGEKLHFVRRDQVSGKKEIKQLAAEARAWHEGRKIKWEVVAKTWGFFGLFSKPLRLAGTGIPDASSIGALGVKKFRYGLAMELAGVVVPDDLAPEILFTTSAIEAAHELLRSEAVLFGFPKRGWMHAMALNPFTLADCAAEMKALYDRAGKAAVCPDLFQVYLAGGKRSFSLTRPAGELSIMLNATDDNDAHFAEAW